MLGCSRQARTALLLATFFPILLIRQIGAHLADGVLDHRPSVGERQACKALAEIPAGPGMGMGRRCHRTGLSPGEQLMGGNEAFAELQLFLTVVGHLFSQLVGMGQKEVEVEGASPLQYLDRRSQSGLFAYIRSSLTSLAKVEGEFRSARGLSHVGVLLSREQTFRIPLVYCSSAWLSSFFDRHGASPSWRNVFTRAWHQSARAGSSEDATDLWHPFPKPNA